MSVKFASTDVNAAEYLEATYEPDDRLSGKPLSVTLWVFLDDAPTGSDARTIWWFGEKDAASGGGSPNDLVLEAIAPSGSGFRVRASLRGQSSPHSVTSADLDLDDWHCVSVVVQAGTQGATTLLLYADENSAVTGSATVSGVSYASWDTFALAANLSDGIATLGQFLAEQIAIWSTALGQFDTMVMYGDRKPPWDMNVSPDFGYWVAAGHSRAGIPVDPNKTWTLNGGELYNQSSPSVADQLPQLKVPLTNGEPFPPTWRATTPVLYYASSETITPIDRPPQKEPSRLQPSFVFNNDPVRRAGAMDPPTPVEIRALAYYHDPNMSAYSGGDYAGTGQVEPPYLDEPARYEPFRDLSQVARGVADWFEVQNFKAGTGVGPGNNYMGVVWLRGIGQSATDFNKDSGNYEIYGRLGDVRRVVGQQVRDFVASGGRIPLEEHPLDWVLDPATPYVEAPWACWFRKEGSDLVQEYMDHFWIALKQQLDERGLCYPLRAHWDYEGWPRAGPQLDYSTTAWEVERQRGCWPDMVADSRYSTEKLLNYAGSTISSFIGSVTYDDEYSIFDEENYEFWQWWNAYSVMVRMEAVAESIMATLQSHFPYCRWSNYRAYVADNPGFQYPEGVGRDTTMRWFNTPDATLDPDLVPSAQYSSPVLYSIPNQLNNLQGNFGERIGYTISEVVRDFNIMRVDAAANSTNPLPLVPHVEDVGRLFIKRNDDGDLLYDYELTVEDSKALLCHLWRRGCDEYQMFAWNTFIETYPDKIAVCQWLRDWVQSIPQVRQDRVGRVSRLGRRGM